MLWSHLEFKLFWQPSEEKKILLSFLQMSDFLSVVKYLLLFSVLEWILLRHHFQLISIAELLQMVKMIDSLKVTTSIDEWIKLGPIKNRRSRTLTAG